LTGACSKRLTCEPFRNEQGKLMRRVRGAIYGNGMAAEHAAIEKAAMCRTDVEAHVFLAVQDEHIISQGHIVAVRLVWDGDDTVCEFEFEGNAKLPL
jgi:plasmid stability protein